MESKKSLSDLIKEVKFVTRLTQEEIAERLGYSRSYLSQAIASGGNDKIIATVERTFREELENLTISASQKSIRKPKTESNPGREGIIFVPIAAQAGYSKRVLDPTFVSQLERIFIPGMPYRGDKYRIFEVEGSSMEPTFKEGYYVLSEVCEPEFWHTIPDYHVFVIVTIDQVIIKRLVKRGEEFVVISDNEQFYPQYVLEKKDVKELWFVKRKMDWEMAPPKMFEIKV